MEKFVNIPENKCDLTLKDAEKLASIEPHCFMIPKSTEIHHTMKPKCKYLNDESTWLAVCRYMHDKIENNKPWARERGYLQNN